MSFLSKEVYYFVFKYSERKGEMVIKFKSFIKNINFLLFFLEENSLD